MNILKNYSGLSAANINVCLKKCIFAVKSKFFFKLSGPFSLSKALILKKVNKSSVDGLSL